MSRVLYSFGKLFTCISIEHLCSPADELIDNALGGVGKVPELRLPQDERVGVRHGVAELEAEDAVLGEGRVADGVGRLVRIQVGEGVVRRFVHRLISTLSSGLISYGISNMDMKYERWQPYYNGSCIIPRLDDQ